MTKQKEIQNNIFIMYVDGFRDTVTLQYPNIKKKDVFSFDTFLEKIKNKTQNNTNLKIDFNVAFTYMGSYFLVDLDSALIKPIVPSTDIKSVIEEFKNKFQNHNSQNVKQTTFFNPLKEKFKINKNKDRVKKPNL